jgi:hypothetical protein
MSNQLGLEKDSVIILANKILDRPWGDPDDDLAVLSRQLLRREERLQKIAAIAEGSTTANSLSHIAKIARGISTL